jgi:hypothetical protein
MLQVLACIRMHDAQICDGMVNQQECEDDG